MPGRGGNARRTRDLARGVRRQRHLHSEGPPTGARAPRYVHRLDRPVGPPSPRLRGRRQLGRRGTRGLRDAHRCDPAPRRRLSRRRQRPRNSGRPAPRISRQVRGRDRAHDAARGRQVRRRGLQDFGRPARRRRLGGQRVVAPARARDPARRRPVRADLRRRWRTRRLVGAHRRLDLVGNVGDVLARPHDHGGARVPRADAARTTPRDGLLEQGPRDRVPRRAGERAHRAGVQVRRRHRRFRRAPQRVEGAALPTRHRSLRHV